MLLVCNAPEAVGDVLSHWQPEMDPARQARVARLISDQPEMTWPALRERADYQVALESIARLFICCAKSVENDS